MLVQITLAENGFIEILNTIIQLKMQDSCNIIVLQKIAGRFIMDISPEDLWVREMVQGLKRVAMVCAQK